MRVPFHPDSEGCSEGDIVIDPLDDHLEQVTPKMLKRPKRLMKHIRDAYPIGVPALAMKSTTDRIGAHAGYSFHLGTPEPELQRIASWILTKMEGDEERIETLIGRLWLRFGREDLVLSSLLLANLPDRLHNPEWRWLTLIDLVKHRRTKFGSIPLEVMLLHIEEMARAGRTEIPLVLLESILNESDSMQALGILAAHQRFRKDGVSEGVLLALKNSKLPEGDGLLRRIRDTLLSNAEA
ncbi:MAG: hypothetical protein VX433_02745 [Candidatus Thermoplasmatota archaeon]|nr:hypothetical protein [Candidatus Thermoplasmatota archaeon]